ncbi:MULTISPECIES: three-helix bundle dimerization domain-containing protein [Rhodococcus]|uniref:three-helix bundle dimerization domain-containing protein n=1 Tax=Rhodococcus sp. APC 3903 TaxID=3035193 RepID=UPI002432EA71|nr:MULTISPECIES: hypothetical protein [Rhodococcus]MDN3458028.1 hypothetical protein [Rhodococcus sp. APC 3903]
MTGDEELLHVQRVITRLISRYPNVPPPEIENRVRTIHQRFAGCRIRDFVPLLVEKAARHEISNRMIVIPIMDERSAVLNPLEL